MAIYLCVPTSSKMVNQVIKRPKHSEYKSIVHTPLVKIPPEVVTISSQVTKIIQETAISIEPREKPFGGIEISNTRSVLVNFILLPKGWRPIVIIPPRFGRFRAINACVADFRRKFTLISVMDLSHLVMRSERLTRSTKSILISCYHFCLRVKYYSVWYLDEWLRVDDCGDSRGWWVAVWRSKLAHLH